ncbi:hypothetical protein CYMTET_14476 [Cymbomonas tetramitiformis]|uniref:prolyl aminopeptidase n=1 Tax=Cymbomonas tetramitiformis TaxID=36881 RepID=A0AAE0GFX4_9CHLO|nr:hypothetical protein CYMTET_14476 [Cymbomonas tetramitiformis]
MFAPRADERLGERAGIMSSAVCAAKTVNDADEKVLEIGDGMTLWYRTWGNPTGLPVLFVHGGPGQCVADYKNINAKFFEHDRYFVVEVDQRGTGLSQPSVRKDFRHMQRYLDISLEQMSADFESVRQCLGIDRWLIFGGSWGSTLGLDYCERYPQRCLGMILRGIFLNTVEEFGAIYARKSFDGNARRLKEFDTFFELAAKEATHRGEPELDPNDSERFIRLYDSLIVSGDRDAIWRFYVFENNLMVEDPSELLDPHKISEEEFAEAQSVSFFEARLFLKGTFEDPVDLLGRLHLLQAGSVPTWVVQGTGDEVCPEKFAQMLVAGLAAAGIPHKAHFIDAGHKATSDGMGIALKACVDEFWTNSGS